MRILLIGAGGVGDAIAKIAARRDFFELIVVSDYDESRARRTVDWIAAKHGDAVAARFATAQVDASDPEVVASVAREHRATHVVNAVEPKFVPSIFRGALAAGADYLDMAMSLSEPHPTEPYAEPGVKLGDDQFAQADDWEKAGRLALVGMGVEPGLSDVFARYAADH
ncbi:saccharopine dehydrogenase NADP-binding domain-containing protein, partial [Agromyces sp. CCNWLW208]